MSTLKELFPGRFPKSKEKINEIWDNSLVVFDTNIYLNLYRYSEKTRNELLEIMVQLQDRVWMPHQVAHEYLKNRTTVIREQVSSYSATKKLIAELEAKFDNHRSHPFLSNNTFRALQRVFKRVGDELDETEKLLNTSLQNDGILEQIVAITENRVGLEYTRQQYEEIFTEGAQRYVDKTPPGYEDSKKAPDKPNFLQKKAMYGDLILWKEILQEAKSKEQHVILVSDDAKDDWWLSEGGKTVGARPELYAEFRQKTGKDFLMYNASRFIKYAAHHLKLHISRTSIEEVREQSLRNENLYRWGSFGYSDLYESLEQYKQWEKAKHSLSPNEMMQLRDAVRRPLDHLHEMELISKATDVSKHERELAKSFAGQLREKLKSTDYLERVYWQLNHEENSSNVLNIDEVDDLNNR